MSAERGRPVIRIRVDDFHHRREHRYRQGKDSALGLLRRCLRLHRRVLQLLGPSGDRLFRHRVIGLGPLGEIPQRSRLMRLRRSGPGSGSQSVRPAQLAGTCHVPW